MREESNRCSACGIDRMEARIVVALNDKTVICDKCIDMLSEIAHEGGGFVPVSVAELERLRACEREAINLKGWVGIVRKSVAEADEATRGEAAQ